MNILNQRNEGFTLVETLVALSLLAMMSGLFLLMIGQFRILKETQDELTAQAELNAALEHVSSAISAARPLIITGQSDGNVRYLRGGKDFVQFVGVVRTGSTQMGLREVKFYIERSDGVNGYLLMEEQTLRRPFANETDGLAQRFVVLENVDAFELSYHVGSSDGSFEKRDKWEDLSSIPDGVTVMLSLSQRSTASSMRSVRLATMQW